MPTPEFRCQVLTYAGNGSNPRTIATTFPLDTGVVAAIVQGKTSANAYHRSTAYPATNSSVAGSTTLRTDGILAFLSGGLQVGAALNATGETYTAVIWQDVTADHRHLNVGSYVGTGVPHTVTGVGFTPRVLLIWGSGVHYRTDQFLGNSSLAMGHTASGAAVTNEITGFVDDGFTLGSDPANDLNVNGATRYWTALRTGHLGSGFATFHVVGTAAADDPTSDLGFAPEWVWAGRHQAGTTQGGLFKGPAHTGTQSTEWGGSGGVTASGGIDAISGETVGLGALLTPTGVSSYGFAVKTFIYPADWILLNDAPESAKVRRENSAIAIHDVLNNVPNTAALTVQGQPGGPGPQGLSPLTVYDPAIDAKIFTGSLQRIDQFYDGRPTQLGWHVTAVDSTWRLNKYRPFGVFTNISASDIVLSLLADFAPGFTGDHVQADLPAISMTFDGSQTVGECLTAIGQAIRSGHWYVDLDDDLHVFRSIPPYVPSTAPDWPPAAGPMTISLTAATTSGVIGDLCFLPRYRYADGTLSNYGPLSNALRFDGHAIQFTDAPIGDPDVTHGAVVARLFYRQYLTLDYQAYANLGLLTNPQPPYLDFTIPDNTTTTFVWPTAAAIVEDAFEARVGDYPPVIEPLPDGPTPAVTVALDAADSPNVPGYSFDGFDAETIDPTYTFALSAVYDTGVESKLGPWSDPIVQVVGAPRKRFNFTGVPIAADVDGHPCVYRKLYARLSWTRTVNDVTTSVTDAPLGWMIVLDNTATSFTDDHRYATYIVSVGFWPFPLPPEGPGGGVDPEAADAPDPIDATTTTLLADPPITLAEDYSQIRTRVFARGAGATMLAAAVGATALVLTDVTPFDPAGGTVIAGVTVLHYIGITGSTLVLSVPLDATIPFGTVVSLWVQRDDLAAQRDLGAIEVDGAGDPTDGVHEYVIVDTSLRSASSLRTRCDAELALFSRPIRTVTYATRDPKTKPGKQVTVDLVDPPIAGTFVIQAVTIDQIQFNATLVARRTVTASSVRFTLDDLLQRVLVGEAPSVGTGSSSPSSGSGGGGGGGGTVTNGGALDANHLILGATGSQIAALSDVGTSTKVLHGHASGAPTFSAVNLEADVTGLLPAASVDFTGVTFGLTPAQVLSAVFLR